MILQRFTQSIAALLAVFLVAIIAGFVTVIVQTRREHEGFLARERAEVARLEASREEFRRKDEYFRLLLGDKAFLERVVRERLGYARPDETVFRFEPVNR